MPLEADFADTLGQVINFMSPKIIASDS